MSLRLVLMAGFGTKGLVHKEFFDLKVWHRMERKRSGLSWMVALGVFVEGLAQTFVRGL